MAHPLRDKLMAVPLHSLGPSAEKKEDNSTGTRRNFLASLRVSLGDEERGGGFDGVSEGMNTTVLVLDGTSKLFLVMGIWSQRSSSFSTRTHFPFGSSPCFSSSSQCAWTRSIHRAFTDVFSTAARILALTVMSRGTSRKFHALFLVSPSVRRCVVPRLKCRQVA
jgi:hypothetical protein